ncbi:MAG TPA: fumarylacetoacetate hydrolase family protein [Saprospiraceae bacterium]|nr:fumarylacetoacetate hydrolase family protein [Saprospiraceae bacterium]
MKIYHTTQGIILEFNGIFYDSGQTTWDLFINDDEILEKCRAGIHSAQFKITEQPDIHSFLPPIQSQELWACGVTYLKSKEGRQEEAKNAGGGDFYTKVYDAERPEVFFKANPNRIVGHGGNVRIRKDSSWDVPEPELTLVVTSSGKIIGYTIGNDMSSRSIEGENPLYLPQAKTYDGCASVGPCVLLNESGIDPGTKIHMQILRLNDMIVDGTFSLSQMKRSLKELVSFIYRECTFPYGSLIMTGTGYVPDHSFTLISKDEIRISIEGIGTLINYVE